MQDLPDSVRPSEAVVLCTKCGEALVLPKRKTKSPPFCSKPDCRRAYQRWHYHHDADYRQRQIDRVLRLRRQGLSQSR